MKSSYYKKIIEKYYELNKRNCIDELAALFPDVPLATLCSIITQECVRKTKKMYHHHAAHENVSEYYRRYLERSKSHWKECGILLKVADEVDLSPALMAKLILEHVYKDSENNSGEQEKDNSETRSKVSEMLKNSSLIEDPHLAAEIRLCVLSDENYGPVSDVIRNSVGKEYEEKLKNELKEFGFTFLDERQLREKGYDKTPDIRLDIPIAIEGKVVNWIESKASFGDEERHKEYLKEQYWSYCNRFGPGLVIYWAGFIDELNINKEQGIIISDTFPNQVTCMDPSLLIKKM